MSALIEREAHAAQAPAGLGQAPDSPAGPVEGNEPVRLPPDVGLPRWLQTVRFGRRPLSFNLRNHRLHGDVWQVKIASRKEPFVVTCHPDHFQSLMKAKPDEAPSLTGESPLRPILGPNSILTSVGERHMRQRKLLLPPFHGEAVQHYVEMISEVAEREISSWPTGEPFALAPRMQAVTLDVIMSGVFGVDPQPRPGSTGYELRQTIRRMLGASTSPLFQIVELTNVRREEPFGVMRRMLAIVDRHIFEIIRDRRDRAASGERGDDVLSLLLEARDEEGEPLTDKELRDELMSLVLAGHETTANSLAWIFERLLRTPAAYGRLRELVRAGGSDADAYVEATIQEGMRNRPVIPMIVRMVKRPWRFGEYVLPAQTPVAVSIIALHHREDIYPQPLHFSPERFLQRRPADGETSGELSAIKPGTYTWIPFGGGIRRCLGATLAMAEQRVVLAAIARRTDMRAPSPEPERARQRNVTTIPSRGAMVEVTQAYAT